MGRGGRRVGVKLQQSPKTFGDDYVNDIVTSMQEAQREASAYMAAMIELSYHNRGFLVPKSPRPQAEVWEPTTRIARENRKMFPKLNKFSRVGKKGYTQKQAQYLYASPTLVDTGALKNSITEEEELFHPMVMDTYIGATEPYIATHEEGGTYKGYDVPARPSQYITEKEENFILKLFKRAFKRA